jgi:hypothetical protein
MAIHTETALVDSNTYDRIRSFFMSYCDFITVEKDANDATKLYFKEDNNKRAMIVNSESKLNFTIYGSDETVLKNINLPYSSSYTASKVLLTATESGASIVVVSSATNSPKIGELVFGKSRNDVIFALSASSQLYNGIGNVDYYITTSNKSTIDLTTRVQLTNRESFTWLINLPIDIVEGLVDYADGVYIPINYQLINPTFPYIFKGRLLVNTAFVALDDGTYVG